MLTHLIFAGTGTSVFDEIALFAIDDNSSSLFSLRAGLEIDTPISINKLIFRASIKIGFFYSLD